MYYANKFNNFSQTGDNFSAKEADGSCVQIGSPETHFFLVDVHSCKLTVGQWCKVTKNMY